MLENIKIFFKKNSLIALGAASLLYTFPVYNKFWAPFDEGIIVVAAQRLLAGEIPYKDFFIIMYPPGQIYVLAFLFKFFSSPLIAGRIYTVFVSVGISMLVFYMTRALTKRTAISLLSWFFVLVSLAPRLGAIPAPIWPGVFWGLCALFAYMQYLENPRHLSIVLTGILAGLSILFRHDIGIFAFFSIVGSLFIRMWYKKTAFREITLFATGALITILPFAIYFVSKSATKDMVNSLILFPFIHQKTAGLAFPKPCLDLSMIFHGSLHFIKVNQYYIPILVYLFMFIHLLNELFRKRLGEKENAMLLSVLLFGLLAFNQVRIRTDPAHLLTVMQPAVILFGFMMHKTLSLRFNLKSGVLLRYGISALILTLFGLLSVKNIDKYIKNSFRKPYRQDIIGTQFGNEIIYVPKEEKDEVVNTLEFIDKNTLPGERIYIGNITHWKDDFGGSTILYFLAGRLPSTKYYELLPGIPTNPDVQHEIQNSLLKHGVRLIVLQDIDLGNMRKENITKNKRILDDFIERHFGRVKKFGKYNIYMKK